MVKRIIRSLAVTALVVLALALPAFAQEEQTCYDRNGDGTYRCDGELFIPLNEDNDFNNEYPSPWDIGDEGYGYPWDIGDESDGDPLWDYDYPTLESGDEYCYEESESYDEEFCDDLQEAIEEVYDDYDLEWDSYY